MKKKIPFTALKVIQTLIDLANEKGHGLIERIESPNAFLHFIDADKFDTSDFYFSFSNGKNGGLLIEFQPTSEDNIGPYSYEGLEAKQIPVYFENWIEILRKYSSISTIYDNPERHFKKSLFDDWHFVEDASNEKPFDYEKLLLLDQYFDETTKSLIDFSESQSPERQVQIQEIVKDIQEFKEITPDLTKNGVMNQLATIMQKARKAGMSVYKLVYGKFVDKFVEKIIEKGIEAAITNSDKIIDNANHIIDAAGKLLGPS